MIDGVEIKELKPLSDERGLLMEFLRSDEPIFKKFGQVYMTMVKQGVAKAWHYHKLQADHFVCVEGKALVVLYDMRPESKTFGQAQDFKISAPELKGDHLLIKIPPGVAHGFTAVECEQAKIVNIPTEKYNREQPDEYRFPWNSPEIKYQWPGSVKSGG